MALEIYWPHQVPTAAAAFTSTGSTHLLLDVSDELSVTEEIGARRKGRKKGCKNKTPAERKAMKENLRKTKNEKERERVKNIQSQYNRLREVLGEDMNKKLCKQKVLDNAIQYITRLSKILQEEATTVTTSKEDLLCHEEVELELDDELESSSTSCLSSPVHFPQSVSPPPTIFGFQSPIVGYMSSPPPTTTGSFEFESPNFPSPILPGGVHGEYYTLFTSPPSLHDNVANGYSIISPSRSSPCSFRLHHLD